MRLMVLNLHMSTTWADRVLALKWLMEEEEYPLDRRRSMEAGCHPAHMQLTEGQCHQPRVGRQVMKDTPDDEEELK